MIGGGIGVSAAIFYFMHWYNWSFWVLAFGIANGIFGAIRAVADPAGYIRGALEAGVEPNYKMLFGVKAVVLAILIPIAWYMGTLAGYINSN